MASKPITTRGAAPGLSKALPGAVATEAEFTDRLYTTNTVVASMSEALPPPPASSSRTPADTTVRRTEADVDPLFVERRSTRAFEATPVPPAVLRSVLEAARWAPSSANGQPWLFVTAATEAGKERLLPGLMEMNQRWARHAPVLMYLFARTSFESGPYAGAPNAHAEFDAGAAWMSLALQAHR